MSNSTVTARLSVLLFTDLVDSSKLKSELGDIEYVNRVAIPHNSCFRTLLNQFPNATEENYTGDVFLLALTVWVMLSPLPYSFSMR